VIALSGFGPFSSGKTGKIVLRHHPKHSLMSAPQTPTGKCPGHSPMSYTWETPNDGFYESPKIRLLFQVSHGFSLLPIV